MNPVERPALPKSRLPRRFSLFVKIASLCLLIALLHIPLLMTYGVLRERQAYQAQATQEIAGIWGRSQRVVGPVLAVPYAYKTPVVRAKIIEGKVVQVEESDFTAAIAYFLPEALDVDGAVDSELRHRGIYDAVVYSTKLTLAGHFQPDFTVAGIKADRIDWEKTRVLFGVSDLHGVRFAGPLKFGEGKESPFESTAGVADPLLPLAANAPLAPNARFEFRFEMGVQGSERLEIAPVGKTTTTFLKSPWTAPSFVGASLPITRTVGVNGFEAKWETSHFSRGFPQSWTTRLMPNGDMANKIGEAAFGVRFAQPVDGYSMAERAQKYGLLFFVLVFAVFFLFEVTTGLRIHPLQYVLVGAGLCLFFLGFLALSEFLTTGQAYGIAAGACTGLVSLYAWSFLRTGARTLVIGGGLSATYGYLYFVLKSQDYALIAGTAALFAVLALVMFCTRRINWYAVETNAPVPAE